MLVVRSNAGEVRSNAGASRAHWKMVATRETGPGLMGMAAFVHIHAAEITLQTPWVRLRRVLHNARGSWAAAPHHACTLLTQLTLQPADAFGRGSKARPGEAVRRYVRPWRVCAQSIMPISSDTAAVERRHSPVEVDTCQMGRACPSKLFRRWAAR